MRRVFWLILLVPAFQSSVFAQQPSGYAQHTYELTGGFSSLRVNGQNAPGWFASVTWKHDPWFGVVMDVSNHQVTLPATSESRSRTIYLKSIHIGPRVFVTTRSRFTPYVHAVLGLSAVPVDEQDRPRLGNANLLISAALGAGLDFKASEWVAIRLFQFDSISIDSGRVKRSRFTGAVVFRF